MPSPLSSTPSFTFSTVNAVLTVLLTLLIIALVICAIVRWTRTPSTQQPITNAPEHNNPFENASSASASIMDLMHRTTSIRFVDGRHSSSSLLSSSSSSSFSPYDSDSPTSSLYIIVRRPRMFDRIVSRGELGFCESYMDGDWDTPALEPVFTELLAHEEDLQRELHSQSLNMMWMYVQSVLTSTFTNRNHLERSSDNIISHYDVGNDLYTKMLGPTMQYTCAYYAHPGITTLNHAQRTKMALIAHKLDLQPGMTVLDIGCGFGAMAYYLADVHGVSVVGVTLSPSQVELAHAQFAHPRVDIRIQDYRDVEAEFGPAAFDRVYSIGMFEHVGHKNYNTYFNTCHRLLRPNGVMLLHTIATRSRETSHHDFIHTYIFPGSELPCLQHIAELSAYDQWHLEDLHNFGRSYAKTLRAWRANLGDWEGLSPRKYPKRFRRMWDIYLHGCAAHFELRNIFLLQLVFTKQGERKGEDDMGSRIRGFLGGEESSK